MDPSAPRVLVIGAGRMGMHHVRAILRNQHLVLAGLLERDIDRHADLRHQVTCGIGSDLTRLVEQVKPMAAIIATPDDSHLDLSLEALDLGLHLLVEKPLAPTPPSARRLIDHAAHRGRILRDGLVERYNPAWNVFLEHAPRVGVPRRLEIARRGRRASHPESGILLDLAIHDLDLLHLWLQGLPLDLQPQVSTDGNFACLSAEHPSFPIHLEFAWESPTTERRWRLEGNAGRLDVDLGKKSATFTPSGGTNEFIPVPISDALESEHQAFRNAILLNRPEPRALQRHLEILSLLTRAGTKIGPKRAGESNFV